MELDTRFELTIQPWQGRVLPLHQSSMMRKVGIEPTLTTTSVEFLS